MSTPNRRRLFSILAVTLGGLAVVSATISFSVEDPTVLRGTALVLIIVGLILGRVALRQPPPT
ncbi:MAG: hypothetical protein ACR2HR_06130 [Euzebya sp.]